MCVLILSQEISFVTVVLYSDCQVRKVIIRVRCREKLLSELDVGKKLLSELDVGKKLFIRVRCREKVIYPR